MHDATDFSRTPHGVPRKVWHDRVTPRQVTNCHNWSEIHGSPRGGTAHAVRRRSRFLPTSASSISTVRERWLFPALGVRLQPYNRLIGHDLSWQVLHGHGPAGVWPHQGESEMKNAVASAAMSALILFAASKQANAASARCAAGCTHYCATKFAMKNTTACNESCQAKHCH